jgi:hypothetical protein
MTYKYISPLSSRGLFNWILNRGKSSDVASNILKKNGTNEVYKFCVDCVHFLPDKSSVTYGKCKAFPKKDSIKKAETQYMVSGVLTDAELEFFYCSTARETESMCGRNGAQFQGKQ